MENQHQLHRGKRPASKTIYSISTLYLPAKLPIHAENCRPIRSNQSSSNWLVIVMPSHNYLLCTVSCYPYLLLLVNTIVFIIYCFPGHYYCLCWTHVTSVCHCQWFYNLNCSPHHTSKTAVGILPLRHCRHCF